MQVVFELQPRHSDHILGCLEELQSMIHTEIASWIAKEASSIAHQIIDYHTNIKLIIDDYIMRLVQTEYRQKYPDLYCQLHIFNRFNRPVCLVNTNINAVKCLLKERYTTWNSPEEYINNMTYYKFGTFGEENLTDSIPSTMYPDSSIMSKNLMTAVGNSALLEYNIIKYAPSILERAQYLASFEKPEDIETMTNIYLMKLQPLTMDKLNDYC